MSGGVEATVFGVDEDYRRAEAAYEAVDEDEWHSGIGDVSYCHIRMPRRYQDDAVCPLFKQDVDVAALPLFVTVGVAQQNRGTVLIRGVLVGSRQFCKEGVRAIGHHKHDYKGGVLAQRSTEPVGALAACLDSEL